MAQIGFQRYCELLEVADDNKPRLTHRETEVLRLLANGKSKSVIGDMLSVSSDTVDTYTRRIFSKLGVNNKTSAVMRGVALGVILASDDRVETSIRALG